MAKLLSLKKTATRGLKPLNYNSGWLSEFMDPKSNLGLWLWLLPSCISVPAIRCLNSQCPLKLSPGVQDVFDSVLASLTKESMLIFCTQWLFPFEGNGGSVLWSVNSPNIYKTSDTNNLATLKKIQYKKYPKNTSEWIQACI